MQSQELKARYDSDGYVVLPGVIPAGLIDAILEGFGRQIRDSRRPFYRQNSGKFERNELTTHGYVRQSFLDIHDYPDFPGFSRDVLELFRHDPLHAALRELTGSPSLNLVQTMLFDANTATQPHQDWWYLDTVPSGHLAAVWVALEDIDERAGRFFVMKGTNHVDLHSDTPNLPHMTWIKRIEDYKQAHPELVHAPALKKGDVLIWNSRTIHGALPTQDGRFSRKSLTAHFIPSNMSFGNIFKLKDYVQYKEFRGMRYCRNAPDYTLANQVRNAVKLSVYNSPRVLKFLRRFQTGP
jgi:phytanoyl-CoA hydroxylase